MCVFFCKHKTAYEMRISDWSSDVCSSDLICSARSHAAFQGDAQYTRWIKRTASAPVDIHKKLIELLHIEDIGGGQECAQTPSLPSELCVDDGASRDVPDALIHDEIGRAHV